MGRAKNIQYFDQTYHGLGQRVKITFVYIIYIHVYQIRKNNQYKTLVEITLYSTIQNNKIVFTL